MAYILGNRQQKTATGAAENANFTTIARRWKDGIKDGTKVIFPVKLPKHYIVLVNNVPFEKGHFAEVNQTTIELSDYHSDEDFVQIEFLELI